MALEEKLEKIWPMLVRMLSILDLKYHGQSKLFVRPCDLPRERLIFDTFFFLGRPRGRGGGVKLLHCVS